MATTNKRNLSNNQKPSSEDKPAENKELQTLTISALDSISGSGLGLNHNETVVKFSNLPTKQKLSPENKPAKVKELQTLTLKELDATRLRDGAYKLLRFPHAYSPATGEANRGDWYAP